MANLIVVMRKDSWGQNHFFGNFTDEKTMRDSMDEFLGFFPDYEQDCFTILNKELDNTQQWMHEEQNESWKGELVK